MLKLRIKKVVALYDAADSGKTKILSKLAEDLLIKHPNAEMILRKKGYQKNLKVLPKNKNGRANDILFAIKIPQEDGTVKVVGIGSAGDDRDSVLRNFMFFESVWPDYDFDIVFVALREQIRADKLGDYTKSYPLMQFEEIEWQSNLHVVRPFIRTGMKKKAITVPGISYAVSKLMSMI